VAETSTSPQRFHPPAAPVQPSHGVWRDGQIAIVAIGARLPARCVKCNQPAVEPLKDREVYWHHPLLYLLIIPGLIIYAIVAMVVRKKATVAPGLCAEHRTRRRLWIAAGWLSPVVAVLMMSIASNSAAVVSSAFMVILVGIIAAVIQSQIVTATRIDEGYVYLKGCGEPFLATLPQTAVTRR
jgi:hypothetical protein